MLQVKSSQASVQSRNARLDFQCLTMHSIYTPVVHALLHGGRETKYLIRRLRTALSRPLINIHEGNEESHFIQFRGLFRQLDTMVLKSINSFT